MALKCTGIGHTEEMLVPGCLMPDKQSPQRAQRKTQNAGNSVVSGREKEPENGILDQHHGLTAWDCMIV